jgi:hypothetical protein
MSDQHEAVGTIGWTERTGGVLTRRERRALARPLLRGHRGIVAGRIALGLQLHAGRRTTLDPAVLSPPDSTMAREAETAAQDLLSAALLNHSFRAFAWGAALAAVDGVTFDRELFYLASLFHDTGLASPVSEADFTIRSAALARTFLDERSVGPRDQGLVTNAIALHHTPGVGLDQGPEAFLLSAGAAVDVFGLRIDHVPDAVRASVVQQYPRMGFKSEFARLFRAEARQVRHGRAWYLHRYACSDFTIRLAPFRG